MTIKICCKECREPIWLPVDPGDLLVDTVLAIEAARLGWVQDKPGFYCPAHAIIAVANDILFDASLRAINAQMAEDIAAQIPDRPSYTCIYCHAVMWHPEDVKNSYCGRCHQFKELLG